MAVSLVFFLNYTYVLNHFYGYGAFLYDSGWMAGIVYRDGFLLPNPQAMGSSASYYLTHFAPLLGLISLASSLFPAGMVVWFAVFHAAIFSVLAAAAFLLATGRGARDVRSYRAGPIAAFVIAVAFALNGPALGQVAYPHYEAVIPACYCLALALWGRGYWKCGMVLFLLGLTGREDAGLHAAAFFGVFWLYERVGGRAGGLLDRKKLGLLSVLGLVAGFGCLLIQKTVFPGGDLVRSAFLGDPPLAHLTAAFLKTRALDFLGQAQHVYFPVLFGLLAAILFRRPAFFLCFLAYLPWALLNFLGPRDSSGALQLYYGFPFILSIFGAMDVALRCESLRGRLGPLLLCLFFPLSSILGFAVSREANLPYLLRDMAIPHAYNTACVDAYLDALIAAKPKLGRVVVDYSIAALRPFDFTSAETLAKLGANTPDLLVFFSSGYEMDQVMPLVTAAKAPQLFGFGCANIGVVAFRPLAPDSPLRRWLVPLDASLRPIPTGN